MTIRFTDPDPAAPVRYTIADSPLGALLLTGDGRALTRIDLIEARSPGDGWLADPAPVRDAVEQLTAYFAGRLTDFDLTVAVGGTPFRRRVWERLATIPYGVTMSYGQLAGELGVPRAARAVGAANGANPVPIVLPCHRVLGSSGHLTGYGLGGLPRKRHLLDLEAGLPCPAG
jgi:methylated-DNA-[protein]-cysteine S-methyltransferase